MKVDRLDIDVGVEGVLIEENRATCVMGHVEAIREEYRDQHSQTPLAR